MTHELKILPEHYRNVFLHLKTFEIRNNDRDFKDGDKVVLREWDSEKKQYTGHESKIKVRKVYKDLPGLDKGYVILQF